MEIDLLTGDAKARVLGSLLTPLQEEEYQLRLLQAANGSGHDEMIPGQDYTYGDRLSDLVAAQERLLSAADDEIVERLRGFRNGD